MATHITNATQLQNMNLNLTEDYILDNSIDLTGIAWTPIGTSFSFPFKGTLDGGGFTISNLTYDDIIPGTGQGGLFGVLGSVSGSTSTSRPYIHDLNLNNIAISSDSSSLGALVGYLQSARLSDISVSNVTITNSTNGYESGGLCGACNGWSNSPTTLTNCIVDGVTISGSNLDSAGGLSGDSFISSSITDVTIENCYAKNVTITCTGNTSRSIGGFIGYFEGTINKCYATGTITGVNSKGGGFFGDIDEVNISNCYTRVNLTGNSNSPNKLGGFVGSLSFTINTTILNSYASGSVTAGTNGFRMGGFLGYARFTSNLHSLVLTNCYSVGDVFIGGSAATKGGFIGQLENAGGITPTITITNCSWYTGSFTCAVGTAYDGSTSKSLSDLSYGTDEPINTTFYFTTHAVYAQGT